MAVAQSQPKGLPTKRLLEDLYALDDAPWNTINKGESYSPTQLATCLFEYGAKSDYLRPHPSQPHLKARGYKLRDLADAWRRYLPPLSLPLNSVAGVAGVARETLDQHFDWVEEPDDEDGSATGATGATPSSGEERDQEAEVTEPSATVVATPDSGTEGEMAEKLDAARVNELAKWWSRRTKQLLKKHSPAMAKDQAKKELREVLAEQIQESALDTEVARVVKAVNKAKAGKAKSARAKS
jgi:hypothetical protein